jgi:holo-[acyl-carrier protein] synthase
MPGVRAAWPSYSAEEEGSHTDRWRIGHDLCSVRSVSQSIERFGERYLRRVFTESELAYSFESRGCPAERLAARFAAKEATVKVLRPRHWWPDWRSIEVRKDPGGWCDLRLTGRAAELAAEERIVFFELSMSHEDEVASAVVLALLASA